MVAVADIFISHSSQDDSFGRELAHSLRQAFEGKIYCGHEVTVWYDATHIHVGDEWAKAISSALGSCAIFIPILSPDAIRSDWVFDEFILARGQNKKILPVEWRECRELIKSYKDKQWTIIERNQYAVFSDIDVDDVTSHDIMSKQAFQKLYKEIENCLGADLQVLTETSVQTPEDNVMQQLLEILDKNFQHNRWNEIILLSGMLMEQMSTSIPADVYYMRGVALQKEHRYLESDNALALALALAGNGKEERSKEKKEKDRSKERKEKEKDWRIKCLQARLDTLLKIGGRWKEISHTAQAAVRLLPEDREWLMWANKAERELERNPRLNTPPSPISLRKLSMYTFGTRTLEGATKAVNRLAWSPNCEFLAAACEDGKVYTWHAKRVADKPSIYSGHQQYVTAVAWSSQGAQLASASRDKTVHIWRLGEEKGKVLPHGDWVNDVVWSPNGLKVASACQNHMVYVWDALRQEPAKEEFMKYDVPVRAIAWHMDSIHLAVGCDNGEVHIWNTLTGSEEGVFETGKRECIYSLIWLPENDCLVAASADKHVHVWERVFQGSSKSKLMKHDYIVFGVTYSSDENYIASSDGNCVNVWKRATRVKIFTNLVHQKRVRTIAWAPDDIHLASAGEDKLIQVWTFTKDPA